MDVRALRYDGTSVVVVDASDHAAPPDGWVWIDVVAGADEVDLLAELTSDLDLDALAIRDAVEDLDLPKLDDFRSHLLLILHGLCDDRVATYELDCFLTDRRHLVTIRGVTSTSVDTFWAHLQRHPELAAGGADELLTRLADVLTRRLLSVLEAFENRVDALVSLAIAADSSVIGEVTAVRSDLAAVRRAVHPQREALDMLRSSPSALMSDAGRRRASDVFDVASRAVQGIDGARASLAETLDAYRGAEARLGTDVTRVLTVYAAVMLPLSLIAGFFGMNFENLPLTKDESGWIVATAIMGAVAMLSLGMFLAVGWITRPTRRSTTIVLGRGLIEAARTPADLAGAVYEISTMPLRAVGRRTRTNRDE